MSGCLSVMNVATMPRSGTPGMMRLMMNAKGTRLCLRSRENKRGVGTGPRVAMSGESKGVTNRELTYQPNLFLPPSPN